MRKFLRGGGKKIFMGAKLIWWLKYLLPNDLPLHITRLIWAIYLVTKSPFFVHFEKPGTYDSRYYSKDDGRVSGHKMEAMYRTTGNLCQHAHEDLLTMHLSPLHWFCLEFLESYMRFGNIAYILMCLPATFSTKDFTPWLEVTGDISLIIDNSSSGKYPQWRNAH